jgi:Transposase DDE domain
MALPRAFDAFVQGSPCTVITRLVAERIVDDRMLSTLFQEHAVTQYDRDITITHLVQVMLDVACGLVPSVRAGFLRREDEMAASLTAFYGKLDRTDPELGMALVAQVAQQLQPIVQRLEARDEPLPGIVSYILDGNMLAGTDHRLKPLRKTRAAALPGKSLVLFQCASGLVTQAVLWEDAHSQERALLPSLEIPVNAHLIADRNFCVYWFLQHIQQTGSCFTVRHHKMFTLPEGLPERRIGRCDTGMAFERSWEVTEDGRTNVWRAIRLELDEPTRDGDHEITLITNLPADFGAQAIAAAYRQRWTIEGHFQRLTEHLHCEIPSLAQPRAALFAFAVSLAAGNMLAVVIAALGAAHGKDLMENVSYFYLVNEIASNYNGMMLALPARRWAFAQNLTPAEIARLLRQIAGHAQLSLLRKTRRGPKRKRRTPNCTNIRHVSTKRVLDSFE